MNAMVRVTNLHKRFGKTVVLDGLSLTVEEGSVYGLVGANGAGQTTPVKLLMNNVPPGTGEATVLGVDARRIGPRELERIGYVSENQEMPEWMTVAQMMAYLAPFYPGWDTARADALLRTFDLPRDRKLKHLSRGMRMKASLASSLAYRPALLILDEPFSGLDPLVRDEFVEGLIDCADETTILISSHDLAEIESFATHIGFLDRGRLQFSQRMTELSERFREVEVTLDDRPGLPREWPGHWLHPEASASVVRFVETRFDRDRTFGEVRRLFGDRVRVDAAPMSLRAIFIALARESRKAA
jgi:ABC-2 type transport system ATP-binding protein